jgi:hypothetical protein
VKARGGQIGNNRSLKGDRMKRHSHEGGQMLKTSAPSPDGAHKVRQLPIGAKVALGKSILRSAGTPRSSSSRAGMRFDHGSPDGARRLSPKRLGCFWPKAAVRSKEQPYIVGMMSPLTKLDVARLQLATAIGLCFDGADPICVFSLAANAWEVIDALCTRAGVASASTQTRGHLTAGKDLKRDYINSPFRNFFKHADRDPDGLLEGFESSAVDPVLFLAVEDYIRIRGKSPVEFQVFQLWFLACHPEKIARDRAGDVLDAAGRMFPRIASLPREGQIASGHRALEQARIDAGVLSDPRTEPAY